MEEKSSPLIFEARYRDFGWEMVCAVGRSDRRDLSRQPVSDV